jgi:hypothetical protein
VHAQPVATQPAPLPGVAGGIALKAPDEAALNAVKVANRAKKRTWFSQFSPFGSTESGKCDSFFQVSDREAVVYTLASTTASILHKARKGDFFPVVEVQASWCKVVLKDTLGWVEMNKGVVVCAPSTGSAEQRTFITIVIFTLITVAGLLLFLRYKARIRKQQAAIQAVAADALEGDIADNNLSEVLQFIETGKKTGRLEIRDRYDETPLGLLHFFEGRIVHAKAVNGLPGREAVNFILRLTSGKFRFRLDMQPKERTLNLSTTEALMEWSKAEDETHRH